MIGATSINQVILMGRLTADPELKQTRSGVPTCRFTVAVTRAFAEKDGDRKSDFIVCVAWRNTAEFICRNFTKGKLILVEGDLRSSSYDDSKYPDVKHYVTEVYVNNTGFGETKKQAEQGQPTQQAPTQQAPAQAMTEQQSLTLADFEDGAISNGDLPF